MHSNTRHCTGFRVTLDAQLVSTDINEMLCCTTLLKFISLFRLISYKNVWKYLVKKRYFVIVNTEHRCSFLLLVLKIELCATGSIQLSAC